MYKLVKEPKIHNYTDAEFITYLDAVETLSEGMYNYSLKYMKLKLVKEGKDPFSVLSSVKHTGSHKGQFGYYFRYTNLRNVLILCRKHEIESIIEVGCGLGIVGQVLCDIGLKYKGIEIEEDLVKSGCLYTPRIVCGDIFDQKYRFYRGYKAVYFWECFSDAILNLKFYEHLKKYVPKETFIFHVPSGEGLTTFFRNGNIFKYLGTEGKYVSGYVDVYLKVK